MTAELRDRIAADRMAAMKSGDKERKATLDYILGEIQRKEKDPVAKGDIATATIQAYLKSLREFISQHGATNPAQVSQFEKEIGLLEPYLPRQLSDDEIRAAVQEEQAAGNSAKGFIMKALKAKHGAALDGRRATQILDDLGIK